MRRSLLLGITIVVPGLLAGCTGTGLFFDHTFTWFGDNPNTPAGNSQTFQRIRGEKVAITPILPEPGNVWPGPQAPDPTLDELSRQQADSAQRGVPPPMPATGATVPRPSAPGLAPNAPRISSPQGSIVQTPNGPSVDVGGGSGRGYRQLQSPNPAGQGILVPNGNGTSTLISPDGSIQTVPTRQ
jgi:hypothetical protein